MVLTCDSGVVQITYINRKPAKTYLPRVPYTLGITLQELILKQSNLQGKINPMAAIFLFIQELLYVCDLPRAFDFASTSAYRYPAHPSLSFPLQRAPDSFFLSQLVASSMLPIASLTFHLPHH